VFVPGRLDAGAQGGEVGLGGEGSLEPLLDLGELLRGYCCGDLFPRAVVVGHAAQGLKLPGHALMRLFPALGQFGGLGQFLLEIRDLGGHQFALGRVVEAEHVVLPAGEAVVLFHRVAVAFDHAAQAEALVQPGQFVRVFHAGVGEIEGDPFADPVAGLRQRGRVGGGIAEETQLGQQIAVRRVLHRQRTAGQRLGDVHRAEGAADGMIVQVARDGGEVFARDQQRGGQAPQCAFGGRPPLFLPLREVDQLAAERHLLLRHSGGRGDRGPVFNARRRQKGLARLEREELLLGRGELALPRGVPVERLEAQLLERLRIILQLRRACGGMGVGLLPARSRPLKFQPGLGQGLAGRVLHLLAEPEPHPGVLKRLLDL